VTWPRQNNQTQSIHPIRKRHDGKPASLMYWTAATCVCMYGLFVRRPFDQSEAQTSLPALLGISLRALLISPTAQHGEHVHVPTRTAAGFSNQLGQFLQFDGSRMAALPVAANLASAERSRRLTAARTGGQQHPVQLHSSRWLMQGVPLSWLENGIPWAPVQFPSGTYPAPDLVCITSGASVRSC
jgi:hypothetical protein